MSVVIDRVNETPIDPDLMKDMLRCLDEMPAEQRSDITGRGLGLIQFLEEALGEQTARADILISFEFRMEALSRLRKRSEYKGWAKEAGKPADPDLIHEVLIDVAAVAPLIERNQRPAFEPVSFFRAALERAEPQGRA